MMSLQRMFTLRRNFLVDMHSEMLVHDVEDTKE